MVDNYLVAIRILGIPSEDDSAGSGRGDIQRGPIDRSELKIDGVIVRVASCATGSRVGIVSASVVGVPSADAVLLSRGPGELQRRGSARRPLT